MKEHRLTGEHQTILPTRAPHFLFTALIFTPFLIYSLGVFKPMNIIKQWNDKTIRFRPSDNYGCLTDMAQATGKKVNDWLRLKSTEEYLHSFSSITGIPVINLVDSKVGGNLPEEERGTWAERKVCLRFAQWCNSNLAVQVDIWLEELLLNGTVSIKPLTPAQMLLQQAQFMVDMEERQAKLEASQAVTHAIALEAKDGLNQVRDQLSSLKEFAVAQPPGLSQDQADLINQAFQLLGATLLEAGVFTDKTKAYSTPWRDLGLAMRNSSLNYDLNARYSNAMKIYQKELTDWETQGKPRGSKPKKPSRIALLVKDNVLTDGFKAAQQVVTSNLAKLIK